MRQTTKIAMLLVVLAGLGGNLRAEETDGWICIDDGGRQVCMNQCQQEYNGCMDRCSLQTWMHRQYCEDNCDAQEVSCQNGCAPSYTCIPIQ